MRIASALVWVCLVGTACSAPATLPDLATAEQRERAGDVVGALAAYRAAQTSCRRLEPPRRRQLACSQALLGEAELLESTGKVDEATAAFAGFAERDEIDAATRAHGLYKAGTLALDAGSVQRGWTMLWRTVTDYPDEAYAGDAIDALVNDGRRRDAAALSSEIGRLLTPLGGTGVADNLLWALADLSEHELADAAAARGYYDRIPVDHPGSGLRDDARWHAARLSRALGDPRGAADRLIALAKTREVARGAGSYFSIWLDDGQLELGRVLRDELGDLAGAERAFAALPELYPASILRDDATFELARTRARRGDRDGACRALVRLAKEWPESRHMIADGPALAAEIACRLPQRDAR
jgi:TolA-binding protein